MGLELKRRRMRERAGIAFGATDKVREAIRELEGAIAIEPRYTLARQELHRLIGLLN